MPEADEEFTVNAKSDVAVRVLSDLKILGESLGFVKGTSEGGDIWYVKSPMSAITQTKELHVRLLRDRPVEWEARGEHLIWRGRFEVEDVERGTKIRVTLSVEGVGAMAPIINPMAGVQIGGQLRHFVRELKRRIEGEASP